MLRHCVEEQYLERDRQKEGTTTDEKTKNHSNYRNTNELVFCKQILERDYKV